MRAQILSLLAIGAALLAPGCFIFPDQPPQPDSGMNDAAIDGGPQFVFDDRCGVAAPALVLNRTRQDIAIDTRVLTNAVSSSCGGAPTLGNDAFIAVDAQAGEYWHFHLRTDPADLQSSTRMPALYLLPAPAGSCDPRDCTFSSDQCVFEGDEHFGFVASDSGRWFLGVDDRVIGGGRYLLDAIRPVCGDGVREHGEACDDVDRTLCTSNCLRVLSMELPSEIEPNDNPTEANFLTLSPANDFTVDGAIGGSGACRYTDTFAVDVPAGATVEVDVLKSDGAVCDNATLSADYRLALRNAAFADVVTGMTDAAGCARVRSPALGGGIYYVTVLLPNQIETPALYRLQVRVVP